MAILEWIFLGRTAKSGLRQAIDELADIARAESARQRLSRKRAALWQSLCEGARDVVYQLLVRNEDDRLDWGLKNRRRRVSRRHLAVIYWWMLLYQMVLFRSHGLDGYPRDEEFAQLHEVAQRFVENLGLDFDLPGPWSERWRNQVSLEAALGLYNSTYHLLGLYNDLNKRIERVSLFTTATEHAYDSMARELLSMDTRRKCI